MEKKFIAVFSCKQSILYLKLQPNDWIRRINEILITNSKQPDEHGMYAPYLMVPYEIGVVFHRYNINKNSYNNKFSFDHHNIKYIVRLISREMNCQCDFIPHKLQSTYRIKELADWIRVDGLSLMDFSERWARSIITTSEWLKIK